MSNSQPTRAAVLTRAGRGAIAVVEVSGDRAVEIVDALFHSASGKSIAEQPTDLISFGHWGDAAGEEVVVCRRATTVEVHCHGGRAATKAICDSLDKAGCETVEPTEWKRDADPLRADAQCALANAVTERTALILLDQYNGALGDAIEKVIDTIHSGDREDACDGLCALVRNWSVGRQLIAPASIVLTGAPNVGKSSLINALVGFERAIVFDQPGTTRDAVTASSAIEGWPVEFIDTAGLRDSDCGLEQAGIDLAHAAIEAADLVLEVTEATDWLSDELPLNRTDDLLQSQQRLRIANKVDLTGEDDRQALARMDGAPIATSALTGAGIKNLLGKIAEAIAPHATSPGAAVPFRTEQIAALQLAIECLEQGKPDAAVLSLRAVLAPSAPDKSG